MSALLMLIFLEIVYYHLPLAKKKVTVYFIPLKLTVNLAFTFLLITK